MEERPHFKRKKYLIAKRFQLKYTAMIIIFMLLIAWLGGYTVYYTTFNLLGQKLANVYPQGRLVSILRTANITLLIRIILLIPFVFVMSIILSHRIAGPVYRMEKYLGEVAKGDFSSILKLRKRDELKNLADAINKMTEGLGRMARENQEIVDKLSSKLNDLNIELQKGALDKGRAIALARESSEQIKQLQSRFFQERIGGTA